MGLDKLSENNALNVNKLVFKPVEKVEIPVETQTIPISDSILQEANFTGNLQKEILLQKFQNNNPEAVSFKNPADNAPVDYFDVAGDADALIGKYTEDGFLWDSLNHEGLGGELAEIAKNDPARAAALTDNILDKVDGGDKDEVAQSFIEAMSPEELRAFAATEEGKAALEQCRHHLDEGWTTGDEDDTIARIDTAIKAADFQNTEQFKNLSPEAQQEVLSRLDANQGNNAATDNLINLATSGEFANLSIEAQRAVLGAFDNHKEDALFVNALKDTLAKPEFQALNATQQAQVLNDLDRIASTESYTDTDDTGKNYLLDNLGNTSIFSAANPNEVAVRNTLDKIADGEIKVETYSEAADPKTGGITLGYTYSNDVIYMNTHPDTQAFGANIFTDTLVHEVNHNQNPGGAHGTPDQFLNEYRAFYVGIDAIGAPPSAQRQDAIIQNLLDSYPDIRELYDNNADFKQFIDDARAGFAENPPRLLEPEAMRQALLDAGFSSDYLNTPGNIDNH